MKTGRTLQELAAELERQTTNRRDYIAPQGKVEAIVQADDAGQVDVVLDGINGEPMPLTNYAHGQMSDHLGIPRRYYERMRAEQPGLLAANINTWLKADPDNKRMIRTLDGAVRAVLSPKYRPLDNFDLANAVLPKLIEKRVDIMSAELTETRMYIKGILPDLSDELPEGVSFGGHQRIGGDRGHLVAAIVISNSEIGAGTLRVEPSVFTTYCTNLMIRAQASMKKYHVGRAFEADANLEVFRDETRRMDDAAFWMKVTDVTVAAFDERMFRAGIDEIRRAAGQPIKSDDLPSVVDVTVKKLGLPEATGKSILKHLAAGGDLTQWGLSSAITRVANDADDYELATDLERAGGEIITLPARDWERISLASGAAA